MVPTLCRPLFWRPAPSARVPSRPSFTAAHPRSAFSAFSARAADHAALRCCNHYDVLRGHKTSDTARVR